MTHQIIDVRTIYEGWGRLLAIRIRLPDGQVITREVEDHGAAVSVLPYDPDRRVATLVRQFRAPVFHATGQPDLLEAPAGMLDEDDPAACARREALEEVGLTLTSLEPVGAAWTTPGVSTELMHLYLAPYRAADRTGAGGGVADEHENITICEISLAELAAMADAGSLADVKTLALVQTLRLRRPDLFAR
ncbi:MAG TPA: NUDIX hydrolase [Beijerinckiaceae bacterium]|nr:NUDIX hydrolase [Beijerinckiaceae bacterium]